MSAAMTSRERMLAALSCGEVDHPPLSFMIFHALQGRCANAVEFFQRQRDLGLDVCVELMRVVPSLDADSRDALGLPVRFGPDVRIREFVERPPGARYPLLHKEYETPDGTLNVIVNQTDDWPHGDHVPFFDDYVESRAVKPLVTGPEDLPALRHLLRPPEDADVRAARDIWPQAKEYAAREGLLVSGGRGVGADALGWLCGLQNVVFMAVDQPEFLHELLRIISEWNQSRMDIYLDEGVDLFVRRAWYEGTDFWSPALYERFLLPHLTEEARRVHQAGARFGYIHTSGTQPLMDMILDAGVDAVIGVDPVQGVGTNMAEMKRMAAGRACLWGGVNGFVTVEMGASDDIRAAVREAFETLGPDGFILSPVDNVCDRSEEVRAKVTVLIDAWRELAERGKT